jgi:hypothetical protein
VRIITLLVLLIPLLTDVAARPRAMLFNMAAEHNGTPELSLRDPESQRHEGK